MKKKKSNLKLKFNKETIAKLNNEELNVLVGGDTYTLIKTCVPTACGTMCTGGIRCCA